MLHNIGMEGFSLGQKVTNKCGMRASSTGELVFQDVKVPIGNMLGQRGACSRRDDIELMWLKCDVGCCTVRTVRVILLFWLINWNEIFLRPIYLCTDYVCLFVCLSVCLSICVGVVQAERPSA